MRHQLWQRTKTRAEPVPWGTYLDIAVKVAEEEFTFTMVVTVSIKPGAYALRRAKKDEVEVWVEQNKITWLPMWSSSFTDAEGQVGWTGDIDIWTTPRKYRIVARHDKSGARVYKDFELTDTLEVINIQTQKQDQPGIEMPSDFRQHLPDWERKPHYPYYRGNGA